MQSDPYENISQLVSSRSRIKLLRTLSTGAARKHELQDQCDLARSTVHRSLEAMEEAGWVEEQDTRKFELTLTGRLLISHYDTFEENIGQVTEKKELFDQLQDDDVSIPVDVLESSTLATATKDDPHAVLNDFIEASTLEVDSLRGMLPIVSPVMNTHAARMLEEGTEVELIIDPTVLKNIATKYNEDYMRGIQADNFRLLIYPDQIDVGIAMFGDLHAMFGAHGSEGHLSAALTGDTIEFFDWVENMYNQYRDAAVPISEFMNEPPTG